MADFSSHEAPAHKAQSLPVMLPGKLTGRDVLLAQVYGQLKANKPILIYGTAGMGKTALAATLASAYTELPGGALWLNVHDSSLEELIVRVGRAYGIDDITNSENPLGMVGAAASTLTSNKPLVVLDGKHNAQATSQFISRCAEGLPVMIVSKDPLEGWPGLQLEQLESAAAITMLRQLGGFDASTSDDDLDELVSILDYIPFAIAIAAGTMRLAKQTPSEYLTAFEKIPSSAGATPQLLALTIGFRALNNALQGIMLMLGASFSGGASLELLSATSGAQPEVIDQVMTSLAANHFVERVERYDAPYYRLHEITHSFAQTWLRGSNRLETLQAKWRDSVLEYTRKYSIDSPGAHDRLAAEMDQIVGVARWCADQGERDKVNDLVVGLTQAGNFVNERGYLYELLQLRQLASSFTTAFPAYPTPVMPLADEDDDDEEVAPAVGRASAFDRLDEEDDDEASSLLDLDDDIEEEDEEDDDLFGDDDDDEVDETGGSTLTVGSLGGNDPELVKLQTALRTAKGLEDKEEQVELLTQIGDMQVKHKMENEAITTYTEALDLNEALDDQEGILQTLDTLSALMVKTENPNAAILHATRGIQLADELADTETKMYLLTTLGDARQQDGESDTAVQAFQQALQIARTDGDTQNEALVLFKLGYAQLDNSDPDTAAETWEQALTLFKAQGKRAYEGRVLGGLGTAFGELGRWAEAINFHNSALYIAREVKDKEEEALQLSNLGYGSVQAHQLGEAVTRYRQALHLSYESNNRDNIVSNIVDLARLLIKSQRHLDIAELLVNDALALDSVNRDLARLKDSIQQERLKATANGVEQLAVSGTAKDYAANAYKLLEG